MPIRITTFLVLLFTLNQTFAQGISNIEQKALTKDTLEIIEMHKLVAPLWHSHPDSLICVGLYILNSSKQINYTPGQTLGLLNMGTGYHQLGKNLEAVDAYQKVIDTDERIIDKKNLITALSNQSMSFIAMGMYDRSIDNLLKARKLCEKIKADKQIPQILNNLGMVYNYKGDLIKALEYYEKCKEEMISQKDTTYLSFVYNNIANILVSRNDLNKALEYYTYGLKLAKHFDNKKGIGYSLKSLGSLALQQKNTKEALNYFLSAKTIFEETKEKTEYLPLLDYLSDTYFALNNNILGEKYLRESFALAQEQKHLHYIKTISLKLANYLEKKGELSEALEMQRLSMNASDSLSNKDSKEKIIRLEERYQFEKDFDKASESHQKEIEKKENFLIVVIFIVILAVVIAFALTQAYFRQRKNNRLLNEANEVIQDKNKILLKEDQFKDYMISVLVHDVRSPIVAARTLLDNLDSAELDQKEYHNLLVYARDEIARLGDYIDNILTWVKVRKKHFDTSQTKFNLSGLLNETVSIYTLKAKQKGINLLLNYPAKMYAFGNSDILKIIFRNLLDNAIKYNNKEDIISIKISEEQDNNTLKVVISDTGPGLPNSVLQAIHQQIENESLGISTVIGAGLGLNICIYYAHLLNNKIEVVSKAGEGTSFSILIAKS